MFVKANAIIKFDQIGGFSLDFDILFIVFYYFHFDYAIPRGGACELYFVEKIRWSFEFFVKIPSQLWSVIRLHTKLCDRSTQKQQTINID